MEQHFRLHRGQQRLTPEQKAEATRFGAAYLRAQLSTQPVDEANATTLLKQAYEAARLAAPRHIFWLDSPFQLMAFWFPEGFWDGVHEEPLTRDAVWDTISVSASASVWGTIHLEVRKRVEASLSTRGTPRDSPWDKRWWWDIWNSAELSVWDRTRDNFWRTIYTDVNDRVGMHTWNIWGDRDDAWKISVQEGIEASIRGYRDARDLACYAFFDAYFAPNDLHALTHFNQMVSGYWPGREVALIVRRPKHLSCDEDGRAHSATGPCIEYHDGWNFYAWHGVEAPERVILAPETLTREDFLGERNLEVRRVIMERMGERFVWELDGRYIDGGPRGVLYEVDLPGDPERVARYVQVQDPSTERYYFLRVPPTIQTAAEAVAWTCGLSVEEYTPIQET